MSRPTLATYTNSSETTQSWLLLTFSHNDEGSAIFIGSINSRIRIDIGCHIWFWTRKNDKGNKREGERIFGIKRATFDGWDVPSHSLTTGHTKPLAKLILTTFIVARKGSCAARKRQQPMSKARDYWSWFVYSNVAALFIQTQTVDCRCSLLTWIRWKVISVRRGGMSGQVNGHSGFSMVQDHISLDLWR